VNEHADANVREGVTSQAGTILIVDDDPAERRVLEILLAKEGYRLAIAGDGAEALKKALRLRPDLILLDVMMPDMDGFEVCRRLRQDPFLSEVCVLMITGLNDRESRLRGFEAGTDDFISKPIDSVELRFRVRNIMKLRRYQRLMEEREQSMVLESNLYQAYNATLEGWARALDLRDKETEGHTQRVADITIHLARVLRVSGQDQVHIYHGALLHDIGKIGIPDSILHKTDALTPEEWEIMRRHPLYAYEMLRHIEYLIPALDIPYCHHERWDGSGYPRGLKGEEIPFAARIFMVVDVWDALVYDRHYRTGWPADAAMEHIKSLADIHFDPKVIEAFAGMDLSW